MLKCGSIRRCDVQGQQQPPPPPPPLGQTSLSKLLLSWGSIHTIPYSYPYSALVSPKGPHAMLRVLAQSQHPTVDDGSYSG